jgi:hypothetical protein
MTILTLAGKTFVLLLLSLGVAICGGGATSNLEVSPQGKRLRTEDAAARLKLVLIFLFFVCLSFEVALFIVWVVRRG